MSSSSCGYCSADVDGLNFKGGTYCSGQCLISHVIRYGEDHDLNHPVVASLLDMAVSLESVLLPVPRVVPQEVH